ncbi:RICIN domain-containing protein [Actinoplanes sp. NEAU-A12]|uniref:RICIN domain-containing protein n=1 Tax=Actinoplanes sandaracinus TaxID=3045177 RepID=A0ABT6WP66_9ACTN|nr:RICIN domain-containing protein [Actinoplanes sandaracinus]MDI6101450.1 RICIN domain-containing protein [Actinoplanes sandaracinus]
MSAHRRPTFRGSPPGRRRAAGTPAPPRTRSATFRLLPVALGLALLGVGGVVGPSVISSGPSDDDFALTALPTDAPEKGLVYSGLKLAASDSVCAGAYLVFEETCTHGPDPAPDGLAVRRAVAPVTAGGPEMTVVRRETGAVPGDAEIARDQGGSAITADAPALVPDAAPGQADFILGPGNVACAGDGRTGKRVQLLYLHEGAAPSRYAKYLNSFRTWAAGVDAIFDASAAETGGSRHIRYVTTPECRADVVEVQLPDGSLRSFAATIDALRGLGYNRTDRKYLMFADTTLYCGISTYVNDTRPGRGNRNNGGPSYARVDSGCWSAAMAAHQLTHSLGATLTDSPNATGAGSCTDEYDLLCGEDRTGKPVKNACPKRNEIRLDCGHDDYFSTNPKPLSYLDKHWNVALSEFLLRSDGGDDVPDVPGAVVPSQDTPAGPPQASPSTPAPAASSPSPRPSGPATANPSPSVSASAGPASPAPEPTAPVEPPVVVVTPVAHQSGPTATPPPGTGDQADGAATPPGVTNNGVQAVLEIREATSGSVRLTWSAAGPDVDYEVSVDGKPVATTRATRARLIGLKPDAKYVVEIRNRKLRYHAKGAAETAPAARPAQNSWFVLTNSLTGGAADLYAARSADGTPVTLGSDDGGTQQQWQLVPAGNGSYSLVSKASNRCAVPLGGNPVAGSPLVQGDCQSGAGARWTLRASAYGFTIRATTGDLVIGVGAQRFGTQRVLVLQEDTEQRHQSWTAVPD